MRVIAGIARGRRLKAPAGRRVRPTADRVKEALFNVLGDRVKGSSVLDLYAGAGGLGIEAISRGAAKVVMVESSPAALGAITANLETTGFSERARVIRGRAEAAVCSVLVKESSFDLIFMDPPYRISGDELERIFDSLIKRGLVTSRSLLILESSSRKSPQDFAGFVMESLRVYGDTSLIFYVKKQLREGEG